MGMAVLLALVIGIVWIAVLIVQFIALLSLIALGLAVWAVIAMYAVSFLGLYFLLGEQHIGWAITGVWTAVDIASAAYRVTIPAVIQVAALRQKYLYAGTAEKISFS